MPSLMASLGVDRLAVADQLRLVAEILDGIPDPPPVTEDQDRELDRRLALMDADPASLRPWAEVEARVLGKLKR